MLMPEQIDAGKEHDYADTYAAAYASQIAADKEPVFAHAYASQIAADKEPVLLMLMLLLLLMLLK